MNVGGKLAKIKEKREMLQRITVISRSRPQRDLKECIVTFEFLPFIHGTDAVSRPQIACANIKCCFMLPTVDCRLIHICYTTAEDFDGTAYGCPYLKSI